MEKYNHTKNQAGYVIGFANVMYTLWYVWDQTWHDEWGQHCITHYEYQKSLTKSLEKAQSYGLDIDMSMRGHRSFNIEHSIVSNEPEPVKVSGQFNFGKYKGQNISESNDADYLMWYCDNDFDLNGDICKKRLEELGWYHIPYFGYISKEKFSEYESLKNNIESHKPVTFTLGYNPNNEGEVRIYNITFKFEVVYMNTMYPCYLIQNPNTKKGMKLKGKDIEVIDYIVDNGVVIVKKFNKK